MIPIGRTKRNGIGRMERGRVEDSFIRQIPWVNPLKQMKRSYVARYKSADLPIQQERLGS